MLRFLRGRSSARKLRLYAVACCRSIWDLTSDQDIRAAVEIAECYADGRASILDAQDASTVIGSKVAYFENTAGFVAAAASGTLWSDPMRGALHATRIVLNQIHKGPPGNADAGQDLAGTLRCIFGNPHRPVTADPHWLTQTVRTLATTIYETRAFDRLPVLGDALEEAGCTNTDILSHCRESDPHVRGCWVVDLVLGKE
jgi:hypothetical protein